MESTESGNQATGQAGDALVGRRRAVGRLEIENLAQEDVDEQEIVVNLGPNGRMIDDELLSFVNVYFSNEIQAHEAYQVKHATHPEVNRHGSRIVWVENSQTGEMVPVVRRAARASSARRRGGKPGHAGGAGGKADDDGEEDELLDLEQGSAGAGSGAPYSSSGLLSVPALPPPLDDSLDPHTGKPIAAGGAGSGSAVLAALQRQEAEIAPIVRYHNLVMVQRATYLFFQGLLAGFCFTTLFTVKATGGSDSQLLAFYQPNAADYRRFFYVLATISLVGSIDLCLTVIGSNAEGAQAQQTPQQGYSATYYRALQALRLTYDASALLLALLIALLYAVAFLVTLLMSTFDVLTMVRDGLADTDQWTALALEDSEYSAQLQQWKAYNNIRVICSVSAWIGSCLFVWKDLTQLNYKSADLYRLRETTVAWSSRVREMEGGAGLDALRPTALKKLLAILKVGMDRARDALSFYEHEHQHQQQQQQQQLGLSVTGERADVAGTGPVEMSVELESLIPK